MEETARQKYIEYMLDHGKRVTVSQHGLFVSADHPFLGSSVDGIVHCADGSKGVLETGYILELNSNRRDI